MSRAIFTRTPVDPLKWTASIPRPPEAALHDPDDYLDMTITAPADTPHRGTLPVEDRGHRTPDQIQAASEWPVWAQAAIAVAFCAACYGIARGLTDLAIWLGGA